MDKDKRLKIKALIDKTHTPFIPNEDFILSDRFVLSSFVLSSDTDIKTPALGAAYLMNQLSISFYSSDLWNHEALNINVSELTDKEEKIFKSSILNCCTLEHWKCHLLEIERQRKLNSKKTAVLWGNKEIEFPNLCFCGQTKKQLELLPVSDVVYNQLWNSLKSLDKYCTQNGYFSLADIIIKTSFNISDESKSVKKNRKLKRFREFRIDGVKTFFGFHIKNFGGNLRLHFYPVQSQNIIYIGYFGKHLPTKQNT